MNPSLRTKIVIVFFILIIGWLFFRIAKLLIYVAIVAIAIGWIWDLFAPNKNNN